MTQSEYKARQVRAKTHEVFETTMMTKSPANRYILPAGLIALATLALIVSSPT